MPNMYFHRSHELAREWINVKYRQGDKAALIAACDQWLSEYNANNDEIRETFANNRMLPSQLDLLSMCKDRVEHVKGCCK